MTSVFEGPWDTPVFYRKFEIADISINNIISIIYIFQSTSNPNNPWFVAISAAMLY
jgi:hypothetical protein